MSRTIDEIRTSGAGPRPIPSVDIVHNPTLPHHVDTVLPNGLRVIVVRHPSVPTVQLRLLIPFADEDLRHPARSKVLAATLFAGTGRRDRFAVDADLAAVGGEAAADVDPSRLLIAGSALANGLATLLDVVIDAVLDAAFRPEEVALACQLVAQGVAVQRADPNAQAREALQRRRYGDHPISRATPQAEDVLTVVPDELHTARQNGLVPRGATLLLVGDVDLDDALAEAERATAMWASDASARLLPPAPPILGGDLLAVPLPDAPQAHLRLSAAGLPMTDPLAAPLHLAMLALGGGFTSRLSHVIRERLQLCYSAHGRLEYLTDAHTRSGAMVLSLSTATDTAAAALRAVRAELDRFRVEPPVGEEFEVNHRFAVGSQVLSVMSQRVLTNTIVGFVEQGLGVEWLSTEATLLAEASVDDVAGVARDFFGADRFTGVILGDVEALAGPLAEVGGVVRQ